jgi:nucleotide-binding universal stress UspA family protein
MYDVLLAIDDDEDRALAQARAVTDLPRNADDVHAVLLHVFTGDNPGGASVQQVGSIRRASEHLEAAGVEVTLDESSGDPAEEILSVAEERDVDLVTVSGRQRSPAGKALLGSASQSVLLQSDRPVLFVGAGE